MFMKGSLHSLGGGVTISPYTAEEVVFESSTPGDYQFKPKITGIYYTIIVGGGAGGIGGRQGNWSIGCSGSSGGLSETEIKLKAKEYTISVGAPGAAKNTNSGLGNAGGDSCISWGDLKLVEATGAAASYVNCWQGSANTKTPGTPGVGLTKNGNSGSGNGAGDCYCAGGASVYNGYGKGGDGNRSGGNSGVGGYVKIIYKRIR